MNLLEIKLENPVGIDEVIRLKSILINARPHDFLMIDTGACEFNSSKVFQFFRDQLADLEPCLTKFKKVVLLLPLLSEFESSNAESFNLCISREEAMAWFVPD